MTQRLLAADTAARATALTALDRTLLVEAGAGSGKTSVLAGRVVSLLAAGVPPASIAAITFTELAAGELRERIGQFMAELSLGDVRADLRVAFPNGPSKAQLAALVQARDALDELVCTTIHGFCQRLLRPYPVEAGMDPGATVMDRDAAEVLFAEIQGDWLRERLSAARQPDDLLVALYLDDPAGTGELLRTIGSTLLQYRGADVPELAKLPDALAGLRSEIKKFRDFLTSSPCVEAETAAIVAQLEEVLRAAPCKGHEAEYLPHLLHLPVPALCATAAGSFKSYRRKGKWQAALKAAKSKAEADRLNETATDCYTTCVEAHEAVRAYAAGRVLQILGKELRTVLDRFAQAKSEAALIDFDDLMVKARDLLAGNPSVRAALSQRFRAVLVDEFQDTDRLQCEILWRLCAIEPDEKLPWSEWALRPGSLFLVGDPKQAIYRFRGADVASYVAARTRLIAADPDSRLVIGQNFRSLEAILDWVNGRFEPVLGPAPQPGFERLFTTAKSPAGHVAVATLEVTTDECKADQIRDAEADAVAAFCARIIGALPVRSRAGMRPCRPDDIALLAPTGASLWRYERALEMAGISVSTQAGKGFYRRQEIQDLIALTRVLADSRDSLALGALLRGPLVGLTEEDLLDATEALPERDGRATHVRLWTPLEHVAHPVLHETLAILQGLARQANRTTPFVLLSQAVEELQVRPLLRQRQDRTAERALANLDQFLEAARSYGMRGLQAFAAAMRAQWSEEQRAIEGRPDTEQQSVSIISIHASKGLEWPVVIPVNMGSEIKHKARIALDSAGRLHLPVLGRHGPGAAEALEQEQAEEGRQRHRLWYVAATRARDLLLLPQFSAGVPKNSFMEKVGLAYDGLTPYDPSKLNAGRLDSHDDEANPQDRARFQAEAELIRSNILHIRRIRPHLAEAGETISEFPVALPPDTDDAENTIPRPRGSRARGLILHKLLEEVLTGETDEDEAALVNRAVQLKTEVQELPGAHELDPLEAAQTVRRGLRIGDILPIRHKLIPEVPILDGRYVGNDELITQGVADAVVVDPDGQISVVVDWKSDVNPSPATISSYRAQLMAYLQSTRAKLGILVFLTPGTTEIVRNVCGS